MSMKAVCAGPMVLAMLAGGSLSAQVPNQTPAQFTRASNLKCSFEAMATGTWNNGVPVSSTKTAKLSVAFNSVDTQDGTAEAVGDYGKSHITVRVLGAYLHFMQMDPYGALYVTTVFNTETRNGRFAAAHTRHEYTPVSLPGMTSRPEQYYGECEVTAR